jgi:hypothetical protein
MTGYSRPVGRKASGTCVATARGCGTRGYRPGLTASTQFTDGTLVAASDAHPDWLYFASGHGTERNWTQLVVAPR